MRRFLALAAVTVSMLTAADVADLSGNWILNVARSRWHGMPPPASGRLAIEHREPNLKYESTITAADGKTETFIFNGSVDAKDHAGITATRLSPLSVLLTKTEGGTTREITNTITKDSNHVIRRIQTS